MRGYIRNEIELETVVKGLNRVVIDAYQPSYLSKIVKPSRDKPWWGAQNESGTERYKSAVTIYSRTIREAKQNRQFREAIKKKHNSIQAIQNYYHRRAECICFSKRISRSPILRQKAIAFSITPQQRTEGEKMNWKLQ